MVRDLHVRRLRQLLPVIVRSPGQSCGFACSLLWGDGAHQRSGSVHTSGVLEGAERVADRGDDIFEGMMSVLEKEWVLGALPSRVLALSCTQSKATARALQPPQKALLSRPMERATLGTVSFLT